MKQKPQTRKERVVNKFVMGYFIFLSLVIVFVYLLTMHHPTDISQNENYDETDLMPVGCGLHGGTLAINHNGEVKEYYASFIGGDCS